MPLPWTTSRGAMTAYAVPSARRSMSDCPLGGGLLLGARAVPLIASVICADSFFLDGRIPDKVPLGGILKRTSSQACDIEEALPQARKQTKR
jgi:hypothetical protein